MNKYQQLIIDTYGSVAEMARRHKIHRHTARKYFTNPDTMSIGELKRLCRNGGVKIELKKGKGEEL